MEKSSFSSNKPYLLRAIYEWVLDNEATPHVVLYAENPQVLVPHQFVENGKIVLNISPSAAQNLHIDNDGLSFSARFGGKPFNIYSPIGAVMALYASENGDGLSFEPEDTDNSTPPDNGPPDSTLHDSKSSEKSKKESKRPSLKVVK